jgi:hypothetical protein
MLHLYNRYIEGDEDTLSPHAIGQQAFERFQTGALGAAPSYPLQGGLTPSHIHSDVQGHITPKSFPSAVVPGAVKLFVGQVRRQACMAFRSAAANVSSLADPTHNERVVTTTSI